ncbi:TRAP transporter small permease [Clostridium sp. AN503]|uniref:TRAP transporter small permease n=1 Tax=Clostridium sp. AN503 TaxID=3160598 RepID=UPI003458F4CB
MNVLHKVRDGLMRILGAAAIFLFAVMTVVGTWQIVSRYVFNSPSTVSEELLTYSFAWMALLSSAYVFGRREHMRMAFLANKFHGGARKFLELLGEVFSFAFAAVVMAYGGVEITKLTMTQVTASLQIPMGYVYVVLPVTGFLIMFFSLVNAMDTLAANFTDDFSEKEA